MCPCGDDRLQLRNAWMDGFSEGRIGLLAASVQKFTVRDRIWREWGVSLDERTVGKLLRKLAFRRLSVRPQHPKSDPEAQARFRGSSPVL